MPRAALAAVAAAAVLGSGVAVAAVHAGHDSSRPAALTEPATTTTTSTTLAPTTTTVAPRPKPTVKPASLYPLPAPAAYPSPCPPPKRPPGPPPVPPGPPKIATANLPKALPLARRTVNTRGVFGKGMWLTVWPDSTLNASRVVAQAKSAGLNQLWLRTGGTSQGWYGTRFLRALLPPAHAAGIKVIAWDFPKLSDPMADVRRAKAAIQGRFDGQRIDGFSPDIETINEGTYNASTRVRLYLSYVRHYAGNLPIIATVMRPTPYQLRTYPYAAEAPYVDVFAPMIYWSCNEPGSLVAQSVRTLAKLRPVHVIGQSYDMGPEGGRPGLPTGREIWRFLDVAKRSGAVGASLYVYSETRAPQWLALGRYPWR